MKFLILVATALLLLSAPAGAQGYNPPGTIVVTPANPAPGDTVRVTVTGCNQPAGTRVTVLIDGIDVGTARINAQGGFSKRFVVPDEAEGEVSVSVDCGNGQVLATIITVVIGDLPFEEPTEPGNPDTATDTPRVADGALPRTGSSGTLPLAQAGVTLLAAGSILVFFFDRRRHEQLAASAVPAHSRPADTQEPQHA